MSCNDIPSLLDLQNNKKNIDDFGRLMGTGTGTSANEVTGQVRPTYNAVMANLGYTRVGTFAAGATLLNGRQTLLWDIANGGDGQEYGWSGSFTPSGKVVPTGSTPITTGGIAVGAWMSRFDPELRTQVFEALRRSYAEAGYNVVGTFGGGFTIVNSNDIGIDESTGKGFTGSIGPVVAGTNPASGGFVDVSDKLRGPATPEMYGAVGNALISNVTPLAAIIGGHIPITNPDATDDSDAIEQLLANEQWISFTGGKGYLVSRCFPFTDSNKRIHGNGAAIVYRGGRAPGRSITGIFQPSGSFDRFATKAVPKSGVKVFENTILVEKSSNQLKKGDFAIFYAHNGVADAEFTTKVLKRIYATVQVRRVDEVGSTTQRLHFDYKFGYSWNQSEIQIGTTVVVDNTLIDDFVLIDEMPATPTPDILPVPEAPSAEKDVAVGLVRGVCTTNSRFTNLKQYNGKYSTVQLIGDNNCTVDSIDSFYPVWFGGGEGYAVKLDNSIYSESSNLSMIGGRHVWDLTGGGWCKVRSAHGDTDQVSFSMHTNCEHDIEFEDCTGGDFYLANGAYGLVTNRVKLTRCTFNLVRLNCLHLTLDSCNLNDFQGCCNKATIVNTNIGDFQFLNKDGRQFADEITSEYAEQGKLTIDAASSITRKKDYTAGTTLRDWYSVVMLNRWKSDPADTRFSVVTDNVASLKCGASFSETNILHTGISRDVDLTGSRAKITNPAITSAFYAINTMNVPVSEIQKLTLRGMTLELNGAMRPFQIVGRDDSVQAYNAAVSVGGNIVINGLAGTVSDKAANNKLTFVALAYDRDAYTGGINTQVESKTNSLQYEVGRIYVGKGTGGVDAYWNGSAFIDL